MLYRLKQKTGHYAHLEEWLVRALARKERLADPALREGVPRAENGLIDADLGGGVIKQRVARPGKGEELDRLVASGTLVEIEDEHED